VFEVITLEYSARSETWDELLRNSRPIPALAYAADVMTDVIIAMMMSFFLTRDRSEYAKYVDFHSRRI
jgi:hypothetical protein